MTFAEGNTRSLAETAARAFTEFQGGRPEAMSELVEATTTLLWHTARGQGLTTTQAEDAVQNTWLRLVQHAAEITEPGGILKWLTTTTRREAWAASRRNRREDVRDDVAESLHGEADGRDGPAEVVLRTHLHQVLWRHFSQLPERCQRLLRSVAMAERPDYAQVAEALGMPVGSIGPTRGRCLARLRGALQGDPGWAAS